MIGIGQQPAPGVHWSSTERANAGIMEKIGAMVTVFGLGIDACWKLPYVRVYL